MTIETPCNRTCHLDEDAGLCVGCGRSGAEIAGWRDFSSLDRRRIVAALPARLAEIGRGRLARHA